jgi:hypothetical protein
MHPDTRFSFSRLRQKYALAFFHAQFQCTDSRANRSGGNFAEGETKINNRIFLIELVIFCNCLGLDKFDHREQHFRDQDERKSSWIYRQKKCPIEKSGRASWSGY